MGRGARWLKRFAAEPAAPGARVTPLELFYDLVFVFAFLNVTDVTAEELAPAALLRSLLVLTLLWFSWVTFVTLGNAVRADIGIMPLVGFATMVPIFVLAVTIPEAFGDEPPGQAGPIVFALCYLLVRGLQVLASWYIIRAKPGLRRRWLLLALPVQISTALLLVAATVPQLLFHGNAEFGVRVGLWVLAIAVEYYLSALVRIEGLNIVSVRHWAERYGQIILIALGESIISLGAGLDLHAGVLLTWPIIGVAVLGIGTIATIWWTYFDTLALAAEQALRRARGAARIKLARDAYSFLHLPMVAGIILFALGLRRLLAAISEAGGVDVTISAINVYALYGGVILYSLAHLGFQLRTVGTVDRYHVAHVLLLMALVPVVERLPALAALALVALVTVVLVALWNTHIRETRSEVRRQALEERRALEAEEAESRSRNM